MGDKRNLCVVAGPGFDPGVRSYNHKDEILNRGSG